MTRLVEYRIRDEAPGTILVEVRDAAGGIRPASASKDLAEKAEASLQDVLQNLSPTIETLLQRTREQISPDEMTITFGVKLSGSAGVIVASGSAEANFQISAKWIQKTSD